MAYGNPAVNCLADEIPIRHEATRPEVASQFCSPPCGSSLNKKQCPENLRPAQNQSALPPVGQCLLQEETRCKLGCKNDGDCPEGAFCAAMNMGVGSCAWVLP